MFWAEGWGRLIFPECLAQWNSGKLGSCLDKHLTSILLLQEHITTHFVLISGNAKYLRAWDGFSMLRHVCVRRKKH
jgi:hypothetical protein